MAGSTVRHRALGDTQPFSLSTRPPHAHAHARTHSSPVASDPRLTPRKGMVSLANPLSAPRQWAPGWELGVFWNDGTRWLRISGLVF